MRLWINQEFNQNEIKEINKKHNVEHYNSKLNKGHAVGTKQKIRELKNRIKKFGRSNKQNKKSRLEPNETLKKATGNMNLQPTVKNSLPPNEVEKKIDRVRRI